MSQFEHGFLGALFDSEDIALGLVDTDLRFVRVNNALAAINGLPAAQHEGLTIRDVVPELADVIEPLVRTVIETETPVIDFELAGPTPAQPDIDRHFLATYSPIFGQGSVIGVGALIVEVSERIRSERELSDQAHRVYENVVQDLTVAQLAMDQGGHQLAYDAVLRALSTAKSVSSKVLLEEIVRGG